MAKKKSKEEYISIYAYAKKHGLSTQVVYARKSELPLNTDGKINASYVWAWKKAGRPTSQ